MTRRIDKPDTPADVELKRHLNGSKSFIMVAGAGSGKTTSLVKALDYIRKNFGDSMKAKSQRVACITYTVVAEQEIWADVGNDPLCHVATIHSFLWDQVKPFQEDIRSWVIERIDQKIAKLLDAQSKFTNRVKETTREKNRIDLEKNRNHREVIRSVKKFSYETGSNYSKGILGHDDIIKMVPELIATKPLLRKILSQKYPFLFVDESQDTLPHIVESFQFIQQQEGDHFCLGFFGDPMQKIYATGVGMITPLDGWERTTKPENFRCPQNVLSVINNIRRQGDGLVQTGGKLDENNNPVPGHANLFIVPSDGDKSETLTRVRNYLSQSHQDPKWAGEIGGRELKVLVLVHRMAAIELGFGELYSIFNDDAPNSYKLSFDEGRLWCLQPFQKFLVPISDAINSDDHSLVMDLLRNHCPQIRSESFKTNPARTLQELRTKTNSLAEILNSSSNSTVREVLGFAVENNLIELDERFDFSDEFGIQDDSTKADKTIRQFLDSRASQIWGYQKYIEDNSPFSTQQGIKGAEFERVLVVLDDDAGSAHKQFSYDKLVGLKTPSDTDNKNVREGKDNVFDRTRRLLYVCCSRALSDLAVVFYTSDVNSAVEAFSAAEWFPRENIRRLDEIT